MLLTALLDFDFVLSFGLLWRLTLAWTFTWITLWLRTLPDTSDLDTRQTCERCKTRMSSLLHDRHSICNGCRGFVCSFEKRCVACESWSDECMHKYLKHMRSLESKSKSRKAKKPIDVSDQGSHSASGVSSVKSTESASALSGI